MTNAPSCPFGADFESLKLAAVRRFFADKPVERTIWEAKQNTSKTELSKFVRKEVCAFANHRGGYLVLGAAELDDGGWKLSGVTIPGVRELHDWIASLLRELDPEPDFDVREWGLPSGSRVAIVCVEPAVAPPTTLDGVVWRRHGTQTVRADGNAIARLAEKGRRARLSAEKTARARATALGAQMFVPFGLAIVRFGAREQAIADWAPEHALREELASALSRRWRERSLERLAWRTGHPKDLRDIGMQYDVDGTETGWRVAWAVERKPQLSLRDRGGKRRLRPPSADRPKFDPYIGSTDVWAGYLQPENAASGFLCSLPVRPTDWQLEYGERAIGYAALMLSALLRTELRLGAAPHEEVFISLALKKQWGPGHGVALIGQWTHTDVKPADWAEGVTVEAAKQMHLVRPAETE